MYNIISCKWNPAFHIFMECPSRAPSWIGTPCAQGLGHLSCHLQGQARAESNQSQKEKEQIENLMDKVWSYPPPLPHLTARRTGQRDRTGTELRQQGYMVIWLRPIWGPSVENPESSLCWSAPVGKAPCSSCATAPLWPPPRHPRNFPSCTLALRAAQHAACPSSRRIFSPAHSPAASTQPTSSSPLPPRSSPVK